MNNRTYLDHLLWANTNDKGGNSVPYDRPPIIESARVTAVDEASWHYDLKTQFTGRVIQKVGVAGPGLSSRGGFMGYFPQVEDRCVLVFPSDGTVPYVLLWIPLITDADGYRGRRAQMFSGDYGVSTEDGNFVFVRKGGIVDLGANEITRRMYVPILNQIKDFCENYLLNTAGGVLRWVHRRGESNAGNGPVELIWDIKERSGEAVVLSLRQGSVSGVDDTVDVAVEHKTVTKDGAEVFRLTVDKSGNIISTVHNVDLAILGYLKLVISGDMEIGIDGTSAITAAKHTLKSPTGVVEPAVKGTLVTSGLSPYLNSRNTSFLPGLRAVLEGLVSVVNGVTGGAATPLNTVIGTMFSAEASALTTLESQLQQSLSRDVELS